MDSSKENHTEVNPASSYATHRLFEFLLLLLVVGCGRAKEPQKRPPHEPASFSNAFFTSVTPMSDGGAYAVSLNAGVYYLRGSEAIRVRFPGSFTNDAQILLLEITPLMDGSAYAKSILGLPFWHLREGIAEKVTEVQSLRSKPLAGSVSAFPLYIAERQKRLGAEQTVESEPMASDEEPN